MYEGQFEVKLTYVSGSGRHGSPPLSDKFIGIKTNLNDVVEQSQKGSQRECCYKDSSEAKLQNCGEKKALDELHRKSVLTRAQTILMIQLFA